MHDYSSLVFFTILSQAGAGMVFMQAFRKTENSRCLWISLLFLVLGALASLGHLGDPWLSWRTIANIGASWLSREIAMCLIFGASIIACIVLKQRWMMWLSAALGLVFIYVMAMVYIIPTEPAWNSSLTFFYFLLAAIMLGGSMTMVMDEFDGTIRNPLAGYEPFVLMAAMCLSVLVGFQAMPHAGSPAKASAMWYMVLLVGAAGIALPFLARHAALRAAPGRHANLLGILGVVSVIWAAEFCGRVSFYKNYVWFGM